MLSHTGEKPFICKQCNYLFVYLHIRHPGTSFLRSSYNYIFKNIAYVIVYVWPSRTWDEILLPFQKGLFFPLGDIRLFLPTRIRICAYAHHPTWIRHGRIRMAIPTTHASQVLGIKAISIKWPSSSTEHNRGFGPGLRSFEARIADFESCPQLPFGRKHLSAWAPHLGKFLCVILGGEIIGWGGS